MRNRKQIVVLNGQVSSLANVNAWVPKDSTFGLFLFLMYTNDLTDDFSNTKLFANDTSLFSVVHKINTSADEGNNDSVKTNYWA